MMRLLVALVFLSPSAAWACLWDYDTLRQERARFPSALELMTGKFLRHSPAFYEWRVRDRLARLQENPDDLRLRDDLAVAYHKIGRNQPKRYETLSNLGTFYILDGDLKKGLTFIDQALEVNPDAHFGRERYQKWLVEYALSRYPDGNLQLPLKGERDYSGFAHFLKEKITPWDLAANQKAVQAVLGMMRFANHDNPLLLEALGDLLMAQGEDTKTGDGNPGDAKALAARAYLLAARRTEGKTAEAYRTKAQSAAINQVITRMGDEPLPYIKQRLEVELADAQTWYDELAAKERTWIDAGADVEAEYDRLYDREPEALDDGMKPRLSYRARDTLLGYAIVGSPVLLILAVVVVCLFVVRWRAKRGNSPPA
jgi:tetratricopeptide (TPR) repeat protein